MMTNDERLVAAMLAWITNTGMMPGIDPELIEQEICRGLCVKDETIMAMANAMNAALCAYLNVTTDLEMEAAVRLIINRVAEGNQPKQFILPVLHGSGLGSWEMVVKRHHSNQSSIILPGGNA